MKESLFAGIDLHSNNLVIGIVAQTGQRLKHHIERSECPDVVELRADVVTSALPVVSPKLARKLMDMLQKFCFPAGTEVATADG